MTGITVEKWCPLIGDNCIAELPEEKLHCGEVAALTLEEDTRPEGDFVCPVARQASRRAYKEYIK